MLYKKRGLERARLRNHTLAVNTEGLVPATGQDDAYSESGMCISQGDKNNPLGLEQKVYIVKKQKIQQEIGTSVKELWAL